MSRKLVYFYRAMLIAARHVPQQTEVSVTNSLKEKLKEELSKYRLFGGTLATTDNPCVWWRGNHQLFPLLAKYWEANCPLPATSTSSERAFSMDGLVLIPTRTRLDPERTEKMVVSRDFWMSRTATNSFRLCGKCPPPPSPDFPRPDPLLCPPVFPIPNRTA